MLSCPMKYSTKPSELTKSTSLTVRPNDLSAHRFGVRPNGCLSWVWPTNGKCQEYLIWRSRTSETLSHQQPKYPLGNAMTIPHGSSTDLWPCAYVRNPSPRKSAASWAWQICSNAPWLGRDFGQRLHAQAMMRASEIAWPSFGEIPHLHGVSYMAVSNVSACLSCKGCPLNICFVSMSDIQQAENIVRDILDLGGKLPAREMPAFLGMTWVNYIIRRLARLMSLCLPLQAHYIATVYSDPTTLSVYV